MNLASYISGKRILAPWDYIVLGFVFHALGRIITQTTGILVLQAVVGTIGWIYIIKGFLGIRKSIQLHGFVGFLLILYILTCIVMIIRGYMIDYPYQWFTTQGLINAHFFAPHYILPYLMPLIAFIPIKYFSLNGIVRYSAFFACICILGFVVYLPTIVREASQAYLGYDADISKGGVVSGMYVSLAFVTLCQKYISKKIFYLNTIALVLCLIALAVSGRRGGTLLMACLLLFNLYFYFKAVRGVRRIGVIFLAVIGMSLFTYMALYSSAFSYIIERGMEDSRSGVDEALLSQMTDTEKIFGKGLNGRYYYPLMSLEDDYLDGWRYGSETGFYNLVLKGGYLIAFVYIVLLGIPAFKGLLKSRNLLCKAGGFYILLSLAELYPFGWLMFNIKFLIIWMLVVMLNSSTVRNMTDNQIRDFFFDSNQVKQIR